MSGKQFLYILAMVILLTFLLFINTDTRNTDPCNSNENNSKLLTMYRVARVMRETGAERSASEEACWELIEDGVYIDANATLDVAMPIYERTGVAFIPVVTLTGEDSKPELQGALFHVDALKAYNRALTAVSAEEHS